MRVRRLGPIAALLTVASLIATPAAIASVSVRALRAPGRALQAAPASQKTLAQAPTALQAAVRATLGPRSILAGPSQQAELTPSDATTYSFGWSAISGSTAVVGAPFKGPKQVGAAYVFVNSGGIWSQRGELAASDAVVYDHFGWAVALYRSTLVVGAIGHNQIGAAYVFVKV